MMLLSLWLALAVPNTPTTALAAKPRPWSVFGGFTSHELSAPGLHLGAAYDVEATQHFRSLVSASVQGYREPSTELGLALQLRWGQRYTASFGLTLESFLGVGVQYTRWTTTAFVFRDGMGHAQEDARSGVSFAPHVSLGPGYDFAPLLGLPIQLYARPGLQLAYPDFNGLLKLSLTAELGLRWTM